MRFTVVYGLACLGLAAAGLAGCNGPQEACARNGFAPGTEEFASCLTQMNGLVMDVRSRAHDDMSLQPVGIRSSVCTASSGSRGYARSC